MREITQRDQENARRLLSLWNARKRELGLTQVKVAKELGFSSQGTVSQYLHCHIALNTKTIIEFARLLRCEPSEIDPSLGGLHYAETPGVTEVPVVGVIGEGEPTQTSVSVRYAYMPHRCQAQEVNTDVYNGFARRGSQLITSDAEEPVVGDDVLIILNDGTKVVGVYEGGDNEGIDIIDTMTGQEDRHPLEQVKSMDPIVEVVRPRVKRPVRLRAAK